MIFTYSVGSVGGDALTNISQGGGVTSLKTDSHPTSPAPNESSHDADVNGNVANK